MDAVTLNYFPHPLVRKGQDALIHDLENAFAAQKILLAHAPTGLGKTAAALAVAMRFALEQKKCVFFVTNRHTQHRLAVDTLKQMKKKLGKEVRCVDLIGKRWMCNQEVAGLFGNEFNEFCKAVVEKGECEFYNLMREKKGLTVEGKKAVAELRRESPLHNEEVIARGREKRLCSYELTVELAKGAKVVIGDYYYLFNPFVQSSIFNKMGIELQDVILIVDEGHNLPPRVTEMVSNTLTTTMIKNAVMEAKKFEFEGVIFWLQKTMQILNELAVFENERECLLAKDAFLSPVQKVVDYGAFIEELELAAEEVRKKQRKSYLGSIASFLKAWMGEDRGFARILSERQSKYGTTLSLQYLCLDPGIITKPIFEQVYAGVVMSGTLKPTAMYNDVLGIGRGVEKEYGCPFPPENRMSIIVPETTTKFSGRSEMMYRNIARHCAEFLILIPGNVALFFPSYDLRDRICMFLETEKKKFWEKSEMSKEEKEAFLDEFKAEKERGGALLGVTGANFAEGIDLPGDLLNGVVVVGLPLGKPDLKIKQSMQYYQDKFGKGWEYGYIYPAMNKCLQSAGRCIRSETDRGAILFLDERFAWQNYFCCFPGEGMMVSKDYAKLLRKFFTVSP